MIELDDDTVQAIREGALPGARFADDVQAIDDAARVMQIFFKPRLDPPPPPQPAETSMRIEVRRKRKPSLDKLIAKAKAAGARSVVVEGVEMKFGEPDTATPSTSNPWDEVLYRDKH